MYQTRAPAPPSQPKPFDYSYSNDDGIMESFLVFSLKAHELDKQLGRLANNCLKLGRVAALLLAIKYIRKTLRRTREAFFRNATALVPGLLEQARQDSERFYIPLQHLNQLPQSFDLLPTILEELAVSFQMLHVRIDEFKEFTDEGQALKSLLRTLDRDLMYRASRAKFYSGRLNTPLIQRYIHQFINELQVSLEDLAFAVGEFTEVGISAISQEQARTSSNLTNILTVSTLFSGVTATTLQMSTSVPEPSNATLLTNLLWFMSLIFSVGAALNSVLAMIWTATLPGSRGGTLSFWATTWIDRSQLVFLGISIVTFSAGLIVFIFASNQAWYTPHFTVASLLVTSIGLGIVPMLWISHQMQPSPFLRPLTDDMEPGAGSPPSKSRKISSILSDIMDAIETVVPFARSKPQDDLSQGDVEKVEKKYSKPEEPSVPEHSPPSREKMKLQRGVQDVGIINSALGALSAAGRKEKRHIHYDRQRSEPDPQIDTSPLTELTLLDEPTTIMELSLYGTIRDIAYSDDGMWLAVTCAKEYVSQSWTGIFDAKTLATVMDTWHEGNVISEHLKWSPSGKKLIVKFEHRFDVWHLDAKVLHVVERHQAVQDVAWFGEDAFLVAEHNCVFKMNLARQMATYPFEHAYIRSIGLERKNNLLVLITHVIKSLEQFEPVNVQSEKQIVIYDMDKQEEIYQVPVLEDIYNIYPIADELDMLITHKDQKAFQLWSLEAGIRGSEITAQLKKRPVILPDGPGDYIGPTCIGGNYNQFIFHVTKSGGIEVWRRESGMPYRRFDLPVLQEEGVHCLSWRRSNDETATLATAGIDSDTLLVWQGEEPLLSKTPAASHEPPDLLGPTSAVGGKSRIRWQTAANMTGAPSSVSLSPHEIDQTK